MTQRKKYREDNTMNNNFESRKFDRRSFLKASGIVGAAGLLRQG